MNPYLSGIMALSQLSPEQFDMGMQRFRQIQQMQPQGLSALQARQFDRNTTGRIAGMGQAIPNYSMQITSTGEYVPPRRAPQNSDEVSILPIRDDEVSIKDRPALSPRDMNPISDVFPTQYSQPVMSPFSNVQGSFGTGAMPYTQPYYQRSFNPYFGGYGMGFGGGMQSYGGFGGGQPMYGGFGGGKGGGMPSYGGGKGGRR